MFKKIIMSSVICIFATMSICFASTSNYSTNVIMPKTQNIGPDMRTIAPKQSPIVKADQSATATESHETQLTPEELYELQKAQALQAMLAAATTQGNQNALNSQMQALANATLDIPSGFTADGFAYGLARLAHNLAAKRGEVNFVSATKIKDKQYYVVCESDDKYANGTFLVDIYPANEAELKDGYQMWFTLYDINAKKLGTAQAKKMHN